MHGGRRRHHSGIPWLFVATIVGIVVVLGAAVIYFSGTGGQTGATHSSSDMIPVHITTPVTTQPASASAASTPVVIATTAAPTASSTGVSVGVSYIGGYSGSYTTGGVTTTVTGSGARMYTVDNATGSISATFQKTDNTATHALAVTVYENGNQLATGNTSASYGKVTVTAKL